MLEEAPLTARRLAEALDAEDYSAARAILAAGCIYHTGTTTLTGPDAIIASYRANGEAAQGRFDVVEYASQVEPSSAAWTAITYTDRVHRGGERHEYRCRQHIRIGKAGLVEEIRHEELPGERERLKEFERRTSGCSGLARQHGIPRDLGLAAGPAPEPGWLAKFPSVQRAPVCSPAAAGST